MKKYPIKLKDEEFNYARIKIRKFRERWKEDQNTIRYKPCLICISIEMFGTETSTCFKDTKAGKKKLIKFIVDKI